MGSGTVALESINGCIVLAAFIGGFSTPKLEVEVELGIGAVALGLIDNHIIGIVNKENGPSDGQVAV